MGLLLGLASGPETKAQQLFLPYGAPSGASPTLPITANSSPSNNQHMELRKCNRHQLPRQSSLAFTSLSLLAPLTDGFLRAKRIKKSSKLVNHLFDGAITRIDRFIRCWVPDSSDILSLSA